MDTAVSVRPINKAVDEQLDRALTRTNLDDCGWVDIRYGLAILIDSLNSLREEGVVLKPDVYLFREDDKPQILAALGFHHYFQVGSYQRADNPSTYEVFTSAIKKCSLLAKREWSLFIKWTYSEINFGVMRRPTSLLSESPRERIVKSCSVPALLLYQEAEHSIEIRGHRNFVANIRFSAMNHICSSPDEERQNLVAATVRDIADAGTAERSSALVSTIIHEAVVEGHGFLVGVQAFTPELQTPNREWLNPPRYHPTISDGNFFQKWTLPLASKVGLYQEALQASLSEHDPIKLRETIDYSTQLRAWADLVPAMLASDGMTLLNTEAQVLGYRVFVSELPEEQRRAPLHRRPEERSGGARWRAFKNMWMLVDAGILVGAYYQSQDGAAFWYGPESEEAMKTCS